MILSSTDSQGSHNQPIKREKDISEGIGYFTEMTKHLCRWKQINFHVGTRKVYKANNKVLQNRRKAFDTFGGVRYKNISPSALHRTTVSMYINFEIMFCSPQILRQLTLASLDEPLWHGGQPRRQRSQFHPVQTHDRPSVYLHYHKSNETRSIYSQSDERCGVGLSYTCKLAGAFSFCQVGKHKQHKSA